MSVTIRPARPGDHDAIWMILEPVIGAGETYALPRDMSREAALAYWTSAEKATFVAEDATGVLLGTYYLKANQIGGGAHACNCGYVTAEAARGKGVAGMLCAHSQDEARARGFTAMQFNLVVSTNEGAVRLWQKLGFEIAGTLPKAFDHPAQGLVDAHVLYKLLV
jgi:ribosomal protein S18 acetylase RimI-like enzyme